MPFHMKCWTRAVYWLQPKPHCTFNPFIICKHSSLYHFMACRRESDLPSVKWYMNSLASICSFLSKQSSSLQPSKATLTRACLRFNSLVDVLSTCFVCSRSPCLWNRNIPHGDPFHHCLPISASLFHWPFCPKTFMCVHLWRWSYGATEPSIY